MSIWTYWEGPCPAYIEVCLQSMRRHAGVTILTPETLDQCLPRGVIDPSYHKLSQLALRVDCIRAGLLATNGGWWWDADTVYLRSPSTQLQELCQETECLYMVWDKPPRRVLNGYIYFRPNSLIAKQWLHSINLRLSQQPEPIWCELGEKILTPLIDQPGCVEIPRQCFLPIDIDSDPFRLVSFDDPHRYIREDTICFGLNHSWLAYHHPETLDLPPEQRKHSPQLLQRILEMVA